MARTYVRWAERLLQGLVFRTEPGRKLIGHLAVMFDEQADATQQAVRASWVGDRGGIGPAYDGLPAAGEELALPRYPRESWLQYHQRLQRAWSDWPLAGHESSILGQLAAAGFDHPGIRIYYASDWPTSGLPNWWSQFWIYFPIGSHTVTAPGADIGGFVVGDGTTVGPLGLATADLFAMRALVRKFKPAHWVCSGLIFEISGWTVGSGHEVGEPGLAVGGETAVVGAV